MSAPVTSVRRRLAAALVAPLLLTTLMAALAACGDDSGDDAQTGKGIESLTVEGDVGTSPKVTFDGQISVDKVVTKTLITGDGAELAEGDQVLAHLWIGNGFTQREALDTYKDKTPNLVTLDDTTSEVIKDAIEGHTVGSRVLVAAPAADAFGEAGNPELGIANKDTVVMVVDLFSGVLDAAEGKDKAAPSWFAKIVDKDDLPSSLDFKGTPKPGKELKVATIVQGDGPEVEKGQTIVVRYLGQVYGGEAPFDANYSADAPIAFQIGAGKVVKGWDKGLVGRPVGSRVLLSIPPAFGYGDDGKKDAGIKGTDTLFFVVDILAAG